jgi:hypothetical protein
LEAYNNKINNTGRKGRGITEGKEELSNHQNEWIMKKYTKKVIEEERREINKNGID